MKQGGNLMLGCHKSAVYGRHGMVACSQPLASEIGLRILRSGGNCVDAAIAIAATLNVTEPVMTGLGGDFFCLFYDSKTRKVHGLNGSGRSPKQVTLEKVKAGLPKEFNNSYLPHDNVHCVTVPGCAAGWADAVAKWGTMTLEQVLAPAAELAEEGFPVSPITAHHWDGYSSQLRNGSANFGELLIGNRAPKAGEIFRNPNLARCLRELGQGGKDAFYKGRVGKEICEVLQSLGSTMTMEDLESHTSTFEAPISTRYKDMDVYECGPNGQGLTALIGLSILADAEKNGVDIGKPQSVESLHYLVETMRLAFADTRAYIADPSVAKVPVEGLLDPEYISTRRKLIDPTKASVDIQAGSPIFGSDTVSFQVVDGNGCAMSVVNSNYEGFGSGIIPKGCGFSLQNRGANFNLEPDHSNVLAPHKRPYHTIIPGMILHHDTSELFSSFTSMGGFAQPQSHVQLLVNILHYGMDPQMAIDQPRFCIADGTAGGKIGFEDGFPEEVIRKLEQMGHKILKPAQDQYLIKGYDRALFGRSQIIIRDRKTGVLCAGSDSRSDGLAIGW